MFTAKHFAGAVTYYKDFLGFTINGYDATSAETLKLIHHMLEHGNDSIYHLETVGPDGANHVTPAKKQDPPTSQPHPAIPILMCRFLV